MSTSIGKQRHPAKVHPVVVSPAEAAELLGISRPHLYNLIRAGELEVTHLGRSARIRRADVLALVGITEGES